MDVLHHGEEDTRESRIDPNLFPFSQNPLAKYLEEQKLGKNI